MNCECTLGTQMTHCPLPQIILTCIETRSSTTPILGEEKISDNQQIAEYHALY